MEDRGQAGRTRVQQRDSGGETHSLRTTAHTGAGWATTPTPKRGIWACGCESGSVEDRGQAGRTRVQQRDWDLGGTLCPLTAVFE